MSEKEMCDSCQLRYICSEQAEFECKRYNYRDYREDSLMVSKTVEGIKDIKTQECVKKVCGNCEWWKQSNDSSLNGWCFRFPSWVETIYHHYCGEFKERDGE